MALISGAVRAASGTNVLWKRKETRRQGVEKAECAFI
jgi:hypothetical protein